MNEVEDQMIAAIDGDKRHKLAMLILKWGIPTWREWFTRWRLGCQCDSDIEIEFMEVMQEEQCPR